MQTKPLLYGLIGFFIGGFIVAVAAATINKPEESKPQSQTSQSGQSSQIGDNEISMGHMAVSLKGKAGDNYDKAFITNMIEHHQSAVAMAKLSAASAKHDEIKQLSNDIITAQQKEISQMRQWQKDWGYPTSDSPAHDMHGM